MEKEIKVNLMLPVQKGAGSIDFKIKNFYHNRQINLTFAEIFVKYFGKNA